jgi:phenylacetate-coenzyme A ligase PaaK-like adenylate-forming protein
MTKKQRMMSLPSRTSGTTGSKIGIGSSPKDQDNAATDTILEMETTGTEMGSIACIAKSRTTLRELKTINRAKTNKDMPTGLKCM